MSSKSIKQIISLCREFDPHWTPHKFNLLLYDAKRSKYQSTYDSSFSFKYKKTICRKHNGYWHWKMEPTSSVAVLFTLYRKAWNYLFFPLPAMGKMVEENEVSSLGKACGQTEVQIWIQSHEVYKNPPPHYLS